MEMDGPKWDELIRLGLVAASERKEGLDTTDLIRSGVLTSFQAGRIAEGKAADLVVGNYVVLDKLGAGGMGSVYKARHRRMRRIAAIKILSPELMKSAEGVQRFQREIEVIARLNHPNVVIAYDAGDGPLGHFLIMEFVDGTDLHHWVAKKGKLALPEAMGYFREAALGLGYIHKQGLIHRDIKPANLLRTNLGAIKVTDLGLVRLPEMEEQEKGEDVTAAPLTVGISGTFDYMAPEQAEDTRAVDHRADIYSLGCTLWFLLTGQHLYNERTLVQKVKAHAGKPIPPFAQAVPGSSAAMEDWWKKLVAKQANHRFHDLETAVVELARAAPALFPDTVSLPAAGTAVAAPHPTPTVSLASEAPTVMGQAATHPAARGVLLVEPSRVQQSMIARQLEDLGYKTIHKAPGIGNGIELYADKKPGVVISSLHLPDGSGLDLINSIKEMEGPEVCHFIVISSDHDWESACEGCDKGIQHLAKPFSKAQLGAILEKLETQTKPVVEEESQTVMDDKNSTAKDPATNWQNARILVVDDSAFSRKRMRAVFQGLGAKNITEVVDAVEAVDILASREFDFVSTDCQMPRMCGDDLVARIRADRKWDKMGLIMVTGETDRELLDRVKSSGADEVLGKMTSEDGIREVLMRLRPEWTVAKSTAPAAN